MNDFVESAKNFVNAAVSRTSWEAQKQLRVHSKQSEIDQLMEQRQRLVNELAQVAISVYEKGALLDAQLSRLAASIIELDSDARRREAQLQDVKNEAYAPEQFGPAPTVNYTPPPVNPQPQGQQNCPNCGAVVRPNSLYCRSCGAKLR